MGRLLVLLLAVGLGLAQAPKGSMLLRLDGDLTRAVLVGGFQGGKWVAAEKLGRLESPAFGLYAPTGRVGQGTAALALKAPEDVCDWNRETVFAAQGRPRAVAPVYALSAPWTPMPRPVSALAAAESHRRAVADELARRKVRAEPSLAHLAQVLRTDLDGDGRLEVILTAARPAWAVEEGTVQGRYAQKVGDYGLVMVRKLVSDIDLRTFVLDFTSLDKPFDGTEGMPTVVTRRVGAVLDLDGDGRMEIVTEDWVHEGVGTTVWRWDGKSFVKVLEWGCGV